MALKVHHDKYHDLRANETTEGEKGKDDSLHHTEPNWDDDAQAKRSVLLHRIGLRRPCGLNLRFSACPGRAMVVVLGDIPVRVFARAGAPKPPVERLDHCLGGLGIEAGGEAVDPLVVVKT